MRPGSGISILAARHVERLPVRAAFWTLIFITLLSALAPIGAPLTRLKGSAFNPATTEVVLKSRASTMQAMSPSRRKDAEGVSHAFLLVRKAAWLTLAAGAAGGAAMPLPAVPALRRHNLLRAHRARAPPAGL
ncbi:hypothetical protein [uncultured Sphingobium sp.]|uniref:hypothetical protein n=1 Tax=uncultured Sphingobium sp. TaxID=316087 RepID=UPI0026264EA0|nr:hypothetical protein [uncultured Sphingobium sp.]